MTYWPNIRMLIHPGNGKIRKRLRKGPFWHWSAERRNIAINFYGVLKSVKPYPRASDQKLHYWIVLPLAPDASPQYKVVKTFVVTFFRQWEIVYLFLGRGFVARDQGLSVACFAGFRAIAAIGISLFSGLIKYDLCFLTNLRTLWVPKENISSIIWIVRNWMSKILEM